MDVFLDLLNENWEPEVRDMDMDNRNNRILVAANNLNAAVEN